MHNEKNDRQDAKPHPGLSSRLDWDDLRYVLAVARAGSLSGAARTMGVMHSTMLRRIDAIEGKLQVRLFERLRTGYVATEAGEALWRVAEQCEPLVAEAERRIIGGDTRLTGTLQVTTGFVVAQYLLPRPLAQFCAAYPGIEVEVQGARERLDLSRREADIALRISAEVPDYLVGRKLGEIRFRVYAWHDAPFLNPAGARPAPRPIEALVNELPWICFQRGAQERMYDRWMHANVPPSSVAVRADHFPTALAFMRTGIGVALMPEFMANEERGLLPLSEPIDALQTPLWILTHPDLRHTARVRAFMHTVGDALQTLL
ncbi:MAG TPA: LysR family transcriptional regulator [Noviherbaspirillum sp.]|uniref:LysR family transcriptional regulator n=1 Tax=Noviherbaspirillum sp. TaxID=1926288 RepID=UPI002D309391|nr:LysR family transcriptional regulator [Noviherbaspirillum sp.]HYD96601.1 LysR family transcriptional regulator [Noviherbaspirillum sp.]